MSDPSSTGWNYFTCGSLKKGGVAANVRKTRSDADDIDIDSATGCAEVLAGNIEDGTMTLSNPKGVVIK